MARKPGLLMALALLVLAPAGVSSLGLGEIRLNSYLNEPLDAAVTIAVSSPEELESLEVAVASNEAFERFGLDRPRFLNDLVFTVEPAPGGASATLRIRSPEPVVEPFLTFLLEANWSGGRLLREYTVLLDPPLFLPEPVAAPQPQAPVAETPGTGTIARPAAPAPTPAPRATVAPPAIVGPSTYGPVRRNDTLWRIANQVRPDRSVSVNQTMVALFEANPDAFEGNINVLRAGASLRVPTRDEIARIGRARATAEVRRQHSEWTPGAAAGAPVPAPTVAASQGPAAAPAPTAERLELVVPGEAQPTTGQDVDAAGTAAASGAEYAAEQAALNKEMMSALEALRGELAETRRLMELKDAEIAALQGRLGDIEAGVAPVDVPLEAAVDAPIEVPVEPIPGDAATPATAPVAAAAPAETAPATAPDETAAPEPAPTPAAAPVTRPPAEDSGLLSSLWLWIAVALVVLLALALIRKRRRDQAEEESFGTFEPAAPREVPPVPVATGAAAAATGFLVEEQPAPARTRADRPPAKAEETAAVADEAPAAAETSDEVDFRLDEDEPTDVAENPAAAAEYQYPFEDTIAGATGVDLDHSDPLAEADFHMAYGLYDQAADLIGKAVEREPDRTDLRLKLLDILFVWGQEGRFLTEAKALREAIDDDGAPEWGRVVIMGRQICPDEPLFAVEAATGVDQAVDASGKVEDAAADSLDFDIGGDDDLAAADDLLDFDLGRTGELPAARAQGDTGDQTTELEIEDLGLDLDLGDATGEILAGLSAAGQEPELDVNMDDLQSEDEPTTGSRDAGDTAELLGLEAEDSGNTAELTSLTERMGAAADDDLTEVAQRVEGAEDSADDATELAPHAGFDDLTELAPHVRADEATARIERPDTSTGADEADDGRRAEGGEDEDGRARAGDTGLTGLTEILEATTKIGDDGATVVAQTVQMPASKNSDPEAEDYSSQVEQPDFATRRLTAALEQSDLDDDDTAEVEVVEEPDPGLELDDLTAALSADLERTQELPKPGDEPDSEDLMDEIFGSQEETRIAPGFDVITGKDSQAPREEKIEPAPPDVTLDEVGTKLDLARAYIDMGDPDGARNILEEVLSEGNDSQRTEAQQLMEGVT
jgi:pilus assembly protein FimV